MSGRNCVYVRSTHEQSPGPKSWLLQIDLETKLPLSIKQWINQKFEGSPQFYAMEIVYNPDIPERFFEFKIPQGAKIIEGKLKSSILEK